MPTWEINTFLLWFLFNQFFQSSSHTFSHKFSRWFSHHVCWPQEIPTFLRFKCLVVTRNTNLNPHIYIFILPIQMFGGQGVSRLAGSEGKPHWSPFSPQNCWGAAYSVANSVFLFLGLGNLYFTLLLAIQILFSYWCFSLVWFLSKVPFLCLCFFSAFSEVFFLPGFWGFFFFFLRFLFYFWGFFSAWFLGLP